MNFLFELNVIKEKGLAFLKIESSSEEFYRKIINIIDNSYKKYKEIMFVATSKGCMVVIEIYLKYFINKDNHLAKNLEDVLYENARNFIIELFENEEQINMFFKKISRNNKE